MNHAIHNNGTMSGARTGQSASLLTRARVALTVWRQRRALAELPARLRDDVGLTEADVHREASRPIWDVPNNWKY